MTRPTARREGFRESEEAAGVPVSPSLCPDGRLMTATAALLWGQLLVQVRSAPVDQTHQPRGEEVTGNHQPQAPVAAFFAGVEEDHSPEGVEQDEGHGEERCGKRATQTPSDLATAFLLLAEVKGQTPALTGVAAAFRPRAHVPWWPPASPDVMK